MILFSIKNTTFDAKHVPVTIWYSVFGDSVGKQYEKETINS